VSDVNAYDYLWYVLEKSSSCHTEGNWESTPWNIDKKVIEKLKARRDAVVKLSFIQLTAI